METYNNTTTTNSTTNTNVSTVDNNHHQISDEKLARGMETLRVLRLELDSEHPLLREAISSLGLIYSERREHEMALKMWEEVLTFPADPKSALYTMDSLACTYNSLGQHNKALRTRLDAMEFSKCMLEWDHPSIGTHTHYVAEGYRQTGEIDVALELELEVLQFRQRFLPRDHPDLDSTRQIIADLYRHKGELLLAEEIEHKRENQIGQYQNEWDLYDSYPDSVRVENAANANREKRGFFNGALF
jgi:tetratricopeptide (TPR) repeat protein